MTQWFQTKEPLFGVHLAPASPVKADPGLRPVGRLPWPCEPSGTWTEPAAPAAWTAHGTGQLALEKGFAAHGPAVLTAAADTMMAWTGHCCSYLMQPLG
jgi:hypothetical protein